MITFDPGPCGKTLRTFSIEAPCTDGYRHGRCGPLDEQISDLLYGWREGWATWPAAIAMSCAWAALLGRAADQAEARLRTAMRHAHKRAVVEDTIARGPVLVFVDPRVAGADLPAHLTEPTALRFGHQLSPAIPDLVIDDRGISGTLTFGGRSYRCVLPWAAIYAIRPDGSERLTVWPEDAPAELATAPRAAAATTEASAPKPKRGGHLRSV